VKPKLVLAGALVILVAASVAFVGMNRRMSRYKEDSRKYKEICLHVRTVLQLDAREIRQRGAFHERFIARVHQGNEADGNVLLAACVPNGFDQDGWYACKDKHDLDCLERILTDAASRITYP